VSGEARAGTPLRLEALATHVGMSITPVREALLGLAQEGWVILEPNRGYRVAIFRRRDIADLYELHAYLFGELARRAARYITPEALAELRALDAEIRATPGSDTRRIEELNHSLHNGINAAADAPRLSWFAKASRFLPGGFGWASVPGWLDHTRRGHHALLDALERRDEAAAAAAMQEQTREAGKLLVEHLENAGLFQNDSEPATRTRSRRASSGAVRRTP